MSRPRLARVHKRLWKQSDGSVVPGIALRQGQHIVAHLTPTEAIKLANRLVDLTEEIEGQNGQTKA